MLEVHKNFLDVFFSFFSHRHYSLPNIFVHKPGFAVGGPISTGPLGTIMPNVGFIFTFSFVLCCFSRSKLACSGTGSLVFRAGPLYVRRPWNCPGSRADAKRDGRFGAGEEKLNVPPGLGVRGLRMVSVTLRADRWIVSRTFHWRFLARYQRIVVVTGQGNV